MLKSVSAIIAAAILSSSGAAAAAVAPLPAPTVQGPQDPWLALSMLTPTGAIGLAGAGVQSDQANPPPPGSPPGYGTVQAPPIPVIAIWLGTLAMAVYILSIHERGRGQFPHNSPG